MVVILVGIGATLSALLIQGLASALGAETIVGLRMRRVVGVHVYSNVLAMLGLILILLAGHLAQTAVWAIAFMAAGEFAEFAVAFYHSAVNGYGGLALGSALT